MPKTETFRSACRSCHGGCGVLVDLVDGQVSAVRGDPDSPLNKGQLCVKGYASIEHLSSPDRLKYPMKRVGERGAGKWERISWEEAYEILAGTLQEIIAEDGAESIGIGTGTGRHHCDFLPRFANALGTPNWCEPGHAQCFFPRVNVSKMTFGDHPVCDYYGAVEPKCILVWGHNPTVSGPDGELQFHSRAHAHKQTKFIVVDPRKTFLGRKSDILLQVRPGTDDALALAFIHVMISEELYDKQFVEKWCHGFDELAAHVQEFTPEWAERITWVAADQIRAAARMFSSTKPATIEWGCAIEHTPNSIQTARAIAIIGALSGNIDQPGGWVFGSHVLKEFPLLKEALPERARRKRLGSGTYRVLGQENVIPSAHIPTLFEAMRTGKPYRIRAFLIFGNNPLASYADSRLVLESLMKLDFLAVMDLYMTPSMQYADLVLPAASWLELDALTGFPYFAENVALTQKKVAQVGEAKQDEVVMIELARRMDLEYGTESIEEIYDFRLEKLGVTFKELQERGFEHRAMTYRKYEDGNRGFDTPTGKVELYSTVLDRLGYSPLPVYAEPPESPLSTPDVARDFPYILTTGARVANFFISEMRQLPMLRKGHPDPRVEIHPEAAAAAGIGDEDWVWIETRRGRIKQKAKVTDAIHPRVINAEVGWWFPERKTLDCGIWESNVNVLTDSGPPYDPAMGTYQLRALLCRISRVEPDISP